MSSIVDAESLIRPDEFTGDGLEDLNGPLTSLYMIKYCNRCHGDI